MSNSADPSSPAAVERESDADAAPGVRPMASPDRPRQASPPQGGRRGDRREDRHQPDALLDMLDVLETTLRAAIRAGDIDGAREATAARVACWVALADLAADVHPAYQLACRSVARWEHETAAGRRTTPPSAARARTRDRHRDAIAGSAVKKVCRWRVGVR